MIIILIQINYNIIEFSIFHNFLSNVTKMGFLSFFGKIFKDLKQSMDRKILENN